MSGREEWMLGPKDGDHDPLGNLFSGSTAKEARKVEIAANKKKPRELNPYIKEGGTGLPPGGKLLTQPPKQLETADNTDVPSNNSHASLKNVSNPMDKFVSSQNRKGEARRKEDMEKGLFTEKYSQEPDLIGSKRNYPQTGDNLNNNNNSNTEDYSCRFCPQSRNFAAEYVIAMGDLTFLALPKTGRIDKYHCYICPFKHIPSMMEADADTLEEVRNFKKTLLQMAATKRCEAIFLESVLDYRSNHSHTIIHVIFVPMECTDPRSFFKIALSECEGASNNPSIIDTTRKGGLRHSIPVRFPYFYVDFRLDQGLVHVIDNARHVKKDFLLSTAADLTRGSSWYDIKEETTRTSIAAMKTAFNPFDWTIQLQEKEENEREKKGQE